VLGLGLRFLVVGGFNTVVTYAIYCVLVIWFHPQIAWTMIFLLGIFLGYYTHSRLVFSVALGRRKAFAYALVQFLLYGLSSLVIYLGIKFGGLGPRIAGAVAIVINVPISFLISQHVLRDRARPELISP